MKKIILFVSMIIALSSCEDIDQCYLETEKRFPNSEIYKLDDGQSSFMVHDSTGLKKVWCNGASSNSIKVLYLGRIK